MKALDKSLPVTAAELELLANKLEVLTEHDYFVGNLNSTVVYRLLVDLSHLRLILNELAKTKVYRLLMERKFKNVHKKRALRRK